MKRTNALLMIVLALAALAAPLAARVRRQPAAQTPRLRRRRRRPAPITLFDILWPGKRSGGRPLPRRAMDRLFPLAPGRRRGGHHPPDQGNQGI